MLSPELWELEVTSGGRLAYEGSDLAALLKKWGSPLHIVLASALRRNMRDFMSPAAPGGTRAEVFYSYKTNPVPGVLRLMHEAGVGAEVISEYELWLALKLGVDPDWIIFNGPVKSPGSIREAISREILLLNINHREEAAMVAKAARDAGKRPRVGVRVVCNGRWSGQFGSPIGNGEAFALLKDVHGSPELELVGLHTHIGGMLRSADDVRGCVGEVLSLADRAREELGIEFSFLDFGGSLATPTVAPISARDRRLAMTFQMPLPAPDPAATISIRNYVQLIVEQVERHYAGLGRPVPRVLLEPGRSLTGNTQVLMASVHSVKQSGSQRWAIMDAGINLAECMRQEFHQIFAATRMRETCASTYRLAGPICSPGDVLSWAAPLPELAEGDVLAIMDAGAYFVPFATSFSFPQPAIVMLDGGEVNLLRRAERFEDQVALDVDVLELESLRTQWPSRDTGSAGLGRKLTGLSL